MITDAIPGVTLTLKGTHRRRHRCTVTVGAPAADQTAITAKVKAFVDQYNSTVEFIALEAEREAGREPADRRRLREGRALRRHVADAASCRQMRVAITNQYAAPGQPATRWTSLPSSGISTGNAVGGSALNQDAIAGKLVVRRSQVHERASRGPDRVRRLLGGDSSVRGFAQVVRRPAGAAPQAGGTIDETIKSQDARKKTRRPDRAHGRMLRSASRSS